MHRSLCTLTVFDCPKSFVIEQILVRDSGKIGERYLRYYGLLMNNSSVCLEMEADKNMDSSYAVALISSWIFFEVRN